MSEWRFLWHELRLVLRLRWARWLLCASVSLSVLGSFVLWMSLARASHALLTHCTDEESRAYLDKLCSDYMNGQVTGSLCEPLCVRREVEFVRCVGHKMKLHVLEAQWAANTVILKTLRPIGVVLSAMPRSQHDVFQRKITKEEFIQNANFTVFTNLAGRHAPNTLTALENIFSECDVLDDGLLTYSEALVCWQLVETEEYVLYSMLRGRSAIPDLYGVCGNMYAVQYVAAAPYLGGLPSLTDRRSWRFRVQLALALLELVRDIEHTPYGTLHLCDMKESNFGVVRRVDTGELVAKAIDVDFSWFESALLPARQGRACQRDEDCAFITCQMSCSLDTHTCTGQVASSNLQMLCTSMFLPKVRLDPALLRDPPASIAPRLASLLDQCSHPSPPQPHLDTQLLDQLASLLHSSISDPASQA